MTPRLLLIFAVLALPVAAGAQASPPVEPAAAAIAVAVTSLAPPDLFSASGGGDLGPDLWRGAAPGILRQAIPILAAKSLSPAGQALARRVLSTGAPGPGSAGSDPVLAGARVNALITQGGLNAASSLLAATPNLEQRPDLAQAAAELALLQDQPDRACAFGDGLATGRQAVYWLRLRAYCQARVGQSGAAQLTLDLAQAQGRDPVFGRLMAARFMGAAAPGPAALRNGLDYALSKELNLDLASAAASPAVAAALSRRAPGPAVWPMEPGPGAVRATLAALAKGDLATAQTMRSSLSETDAQSGGAFDLALLDAALAAASGRGLEPALDRLIERGGIEGPKVRGRAQTAALFLAALGAPMSENARGEFAGFAVGGEGKAAAPRLMALDAAAAEKRLGEAALLALWVSADAGAAGPAPGDRARIIRALRVAGLEADAKAFALEGLLQLR